MKYQWRDASFQPGTLHHREGREAFLKELFEGNKTNTFCLKEDPVGKNVNAIFEVLDLNSISLRSLKNSSSGRCTGFKLNVLIAWENLSHFISLFHFVFQFQPSLTCCHFSSDRAGWRSCHAAAVRASCHQWQCAIQCPGVPGTTVTYTVSQSHSRQQRCVTIDFLHSILWHTYTSVILSLTWDQKEERLKNTYRTA